MTTAGHKQAGPAGFTIGGNGRDGHTRRPAGTRRGHRAHPPHTADTQRVPLAVAAGVGVARRMDDVGGHTAMKKLLLRLLSLGLSLVSGMLAGALFKLPRPQG